MSILGDGARHIVNTRSRILFVGEAIALAHVGRPALLATWARQAGFEVSLACGPAYGYAAQAQGIDPLPLPTVDSRQFFSRLARGKFMYTRGDLETYVSAERALIRHTRPALIVGDFRLTLSVSARLEGVPLVALMQAHWSPSARAPLPSLRGGAWEALPGLLRRGFFRCVRPLAYRLFARPLDELRRRHGLPPLRDFRRSYTDSEYCAYLDLPALSPLPRLPRRHFFLGPLFWTAASSPENRGAFSPAASVRSRRVAYVTWGSTGDAAVLPRVLRTLLSEGLDAVVTGCHIQSASLPRDLAAGGSERLTFLKTMDPTQVLAGAEVTVCHGGHGSVYQSLAAGVPVLCLPANPDQELMARAVTAAGAGAWISSYDATPARISSALRRSASAPCRRSAAALAQALAKQDVRARWLDRLHDILRLQPLPRLGLRAEKPQAGPGSIVQPCPVSSLLRRPGIGPVW